MSVEALIGHTGFVGSNLARQHRFSLCFNSKNIGDIAGRDIDLLVCAGAPAEKWKANREPERDREVIRALATSVGRARVRAAVLISTVDVNPEPGADEDVFLVPPEGAYGKHRFLLEKYFQDHFDTLIVRLPGLYGRGIKKNVIYDFLHDNEVPKIHSEAQFQFYGLDRLWRDIEIARVAGLRSVQLATAPVRVAEIAEVAFGRVFANCPDGVTPARYDMRTRHDALFGGRQGYLEDAATVLDGIRRFVAATRSAQP